MAGFGCSPSMWRRTGTPEAPCPSEENSPLASNPLVQPLEEPAAWDDSVSNKTKPRVGLRLRRDSSGLWSGVRVVALSCRFHCALVVLCRFGRYVVRQLVQSHGWCSGRPAGNRELSPKRRAFILSVRVSPIRSLRVHPIKAGRLAIARPLSPVRTCLRNL